MRKNGMVTISTNYEVGVGAPFDARMVVQEKADLFNKYRWVYAYNGMITVVASDPDETNNGIYVLKDRCNLTEEAGWEKIATVDDIGGGGFVTESELQEAIGRIDTAIEDIKEELEDEIKNSKVVVNTYDDLLNLVGDENKVYYLKEDGMVYIYADGSFVCVGADYNNINVINCGSAEDE